MVRSTWPLSFRKSTVVASIRVRAGSPFCVDFKATIHLTLKLVWCKNSKNNEFRTKKFPNPEFLYGISSFCTLSENNSFLHGKISYFCIFLVKNRILNTEFSAMSHAIHKIVSKRRYQSYFQNFFFLPSLESFSLDPFSPASVAFFTAFRNLGQCIELL